MIEIVPSDKPPFEGVFPPVRLHLTSETCSPKSAATLFVHARFRDYLEITRPRIVLTVVVTTLAGFLTSTSSVNLRAFLFLCAGVSLVAASATAFNQVLERVEDARMYRTRKRPLVQGRIQPTNAVWFASITALIGLGLLSIVSLASALVAFTAVVIYDLAYTPLKRTTTWSLYIGAIPGALPPLIGSVFAEHCVSLAGLILFAFLFIWQIPHFLAIGWLHRDDYKRAGFHVLAVEDAKGSKSARIALFFASALLFIDFCAAGAGYWSPLQLVVSAISVAVVMFCAHQLLTIPTRTSAKKLFMATNISLLVTMVNLIIPSLFRVWYF